MCIIILYDYMYCISSYKLLSTCQAHLLNIHVHVQFNKQQNPIRSFCISEQQSYIETLSIGLDELRKKRLHD